MEFCEKETIRDGHVPKTKGMPVWTDSMWTLEKLQVGMQLVKGVNGFIYRLRTTGQLQFSVRVLPDHLREVRARMLPNDVRYTDEDRHIQELQQWRLGPLPYTRQQPEIVGMLLEWSRKAGVPWIVVPKAPDPRQRSKNEYFWFVAAEGPPPLNERNGECESLPDTRNDAREGKAQQGETKSLDETQRGERTWRGSVDDARSMEQKRAHHLHSEQEQEEKRYRGMRKAEIDKQIEIFPVRHAKRWRTQ